MGYSVAVSVSDPVPPLDSSGLQIASMAWSAADARSFSAAASAFSSSSSSSSSLSSSSSSSFSCSSPSSSSPSSSSSSNPKGSARCGNPSGASTPTCSSSPRASSPGRGLKRPQASDLPLPLPGDCERLAADHRACAHEKRTKHDQGMPSVDAKVATGRGGWRQRIRGKDRGRPPLGDQLWCGAMAHDAMARGTWCYGAWRCGAWRYGTWCYGTWGYGTWGYGTGGYGAWGYGAWALTCARCGEPRGGES